MPANRVSQKQIEEWTENPVTLAALKESKAALIEILETPSVDCLCHGDPQQTQENLVGLDARGHSWLTFTDVLSGDWSIFEELEDESD